MAAPLAMTMITHASLYCTRDVKRVLDIGCWVGNNTLMFRHVVNIGTGN